MNKKIEKIKPLSPYTRELNVMQILEEKFTSNNNIPITMARITNSEFDELKLFIISAIKEDRKKIKLNKSDVIGI